MKQYLPQMKLRTAECRIGVVGLYASGKTVFLTSLINHLRDYGAGGFELGADPRHPIQLRKFRELPPDKGWERFDYETYRDAFVHKRWPRKTKDSSQYVCSFERSDWPFSVAKLKLFDLPGERIADAAMAAMKYDAWSDHVLKLIRKETAYRECCADYLQVIEKPELATPEVLSAYKLALARLALAYKPYISPSTFLLDLQARVNKRRSPEVMAADFPAGLDATCEFAPLPLEARGRHCGLTAAFAERYEAYRQKVVVPLVSTLKSCHALIVLADVTMLLAGGVGMHDDNRQILLDLLEVLSPGETPLGKIIKGLSSVILPHGWRPGWITKIAFVAPKLDQVHPDDRGNMVTLLRRMIEKPARDRDGLRYEFFNSSAVMSTEKFPTTDGDRWLRGVVLYNEKGEKQPFAEMQKFRVSELPDDWPRDWQPGVFSFPDVYPLIPPRRNCPPEQVNLDRILEFVMS